MNEPYGTCRQSKIYDYEQENLELGENEQALDEAYESYGCASPQQLFSRETRRSLQLICLGGPPHVAKRLDVVMIETSLLNAIGK